MKIESNKGNVPTQVKDAPRAASTTGVGTPKAGVGAYAAAGGENVAINPLATRLAALEQSVGSNVEFDAAKVEAIKQAIAEGRFKIDSDAVAGKLLAAVKEFVLAAPSGQE